ncbi:sugar phosphate nucleotidyltransferase [Streptomyces longwoodensis]|uniref:sugar phosphate nucleotidyltransferase n=1 Tax=Streptomyces longwoodensis TaxID=68231 RepID=UPI0033C2F53D
MKALVLAGGAGTRLRPITHTSAKQLVPVANKAVLFYGLESIAAAGITDVGVIVGDTADEIRAAVGDGPAFGLDVTYIPQDKPLGLAHAVLIARDWLGDDDFVMYLGNNFIVGPFTSVAENCRIADSELEFSIVLRESSIEESLIGRHVEVTPAPVVPSAHRLILGDHSKVQIHT